MTQSPASGASQPPVQTPVVYRVAALAPHAHRFAVTVELPAGLAAAGAPLTLQFPVWAPGSYLIREFERQVSGLAAMGPDGAPRDLVKLDKNSWALFGAENGATLTYTVYANDLTVRTSHLDGSHGFFNGSNLFFTVEGFESAPCVLNVTVPDNTASPWKVFAGETPTKTTPTTTTFSLRDFDHLIDTPVEMGPHDELTFEAAGVTHRVVLHGRNNAPKMQLLNDLRRVVEEQAKLYGGLPHPGYLFIIHHSAGGYGGLEHAHSTVLLCDHSAYTPGKPYRTFLGLASHEYFHLWNVKRVKPRAFTPYDLSGENYTTLLWAFEGITSYYDDLFLARAGLIKPSRYLCLLGESFTRNFQTPGRRLQTLAEASFDTWIKHYRRDEDSANTTTDYYLKGSLVALSLDLLIRRETSGRASLDDVMRRLFKDFGQPGSPGVPEDGVEKIASEIAGTDLSAFFATAIRGTADLPFNDYLDYVGLRLYVRAAESLQDKGGTAPASDDPVPFAYIGLLANETGPVLKVNSVRAGSPAEQAGIYAHDEIIAMDGVRVSGSGFFPKLNSYKPGEVVRLHVFRRDELLEVPVTLGQAPRDVAYLWRVPDVTPAQKKNYEAWIGSPWPTQMKALPVDSPTEFTP